MTDAATARDRLSVGVYDLYWSTLGGGELVDGRIAQALSGAHDVTLLGPEPVDVSATRERLGLDLSACEYRRVTDDREAGHASAEFDLFVNGTYLSTAVSQAPLSYYYVHFPGQVRGAADRWRHRMGVAGVKALSVPRRDLPRRLGEIQAAFDRRVYRNEFLPTYRRYLANSAFTAGWTNRLWGVDADVLYPPVRGGLAPGPKQPMIAVVGRFFDPRSGHSKKQLDLLRTFERLHRAGRVDGWELVIVGGCDARNRDYALAVKRAAKGLPVKVLVNAPGDVVEQTLASATLYWHAAGFGEDEHRHPERFEHFGISVVEAMTAGAVPLVFGRAGPAEIVRPGADGEHWIDLDELAERTLDLIGHPERRSELAAESVRRARSFLGERFDDQLRSMIDLDWSDRS